MPDYTLDYLFIAETLAGDIIRQSPDDKPRVSKTGSSFTDVADKHLKRFSLVGKGHVFTIDLLDGHVEVDGNKIYPPVLIVPGAKLELIYQRQITRSWTAGINGQGAILKPSVKYLLGWEYQKGDKRPNYILTIE